MKGIWMVLARGLVALMRPAWAQTVDEFDGHVTWASRWVHPVVEHHRAFRHP